MGGCCSSYIEDFEVEEAKTMTELYNIIKSRTSEQIIMKKEVMNLMKGYILCYGDDDDFDDIDISDLM